MFMSAAVAQDVQMNPADNFGIQDNSTTQSETNHAVSSNAVLTVLVPPSMYVSDSVNVLGVWTDPELAWYEYASALVEL